MKEDPRVLTWWDKNAGERQSSESWMWRKSISHAPEKVRSSTHPATAMCGPVFGCFRSWTYVGRGFHLFPPFDTFTHHLILHNIYKIRPNKEYPYSSLEMKLNFNDPIPFNSSMPIIPTLRVSLKPTAFIEGEFTKVKFNILYWI